MPQHTRNLQIEHERADPDSRSVPCVLSSEFPVTRDGFKEVLDHSPSAINLERSPLPLQVQHDSSRLNIGVAENLKIVGRKLRGLIRFGKSPEAEEIFQDVLDGVVRSLSISYSWDDYQNEADGVVRVTRWTPAEVSVVGVPADPSAGFFRSQSNINGVTMTTEIAKKAAGEIRAETQQREKVEMDRCESIRNLGNSHQRNTLAIEAIEGGKTVDEFRAMILEASQKVIPRIPTAAEMHRSNTQDEDLAAYRSGQWVRAQLLDNRGAQDWCRDHGLNVRSMSGVISSAGGFLVPTELSSEIINLTEQYGVARQECRVIPMNSDRLDVPRRLGGLTSFYVGQGDAITESDASWDQIGLNTKKLAVLSRYSSELAEDSIIDLGAWLAEEVSRGFAEAEDRALFLGDGTSTYGGMYGVNPKILTTAGAIDAASGIDIFSEVTNTDLATVKAALPAYAQQRAKWYCSSAAYALVFERLAAAAGGNSMMSLADGMRPAYLGREIVLSEVMPSSTGDLSDEVMLLYGDLESAVTFGLRRDIRISIDESRFFDTDQIAFKATERLDLVCHDVGTAAAAGSVTALVGE